MPITGMAAQPYVQVPIEGRKCEDRTMILTPRIAAAVTCSALLGASLTLVGATPSFATSTQTYDEPGTYQFEVPAAVTELTVDALGAGGSNSSHSGSTGGDGCQVSAASITVTPGQSVTVVVGGAGTGSSAYYGSGGGSSNVNAGDVGNQVIAGGGGGGQGPGIAGGDGCAANTGAGGAGSTFNGSGGNGGDAGIGGQGGGSAASGGNGNGGPGGDSYYSSTIAGGSGVGAGTGGSGTSNAGGSGGGGGFGGGGVGESGGGGAGGSVGSGDDVTYEPGGNGGVTGGAAAGDGAVTLSWVLPVGPASFANTSFGSVSTGSAADLPVTVTNDGGVDLTPTGFVATGTGVEIQNLPNSCAVSTPIAPGGSCVVNLRWTPTAEGGLTGAELSVAYSGGADPSDSTPITGTATAAGLQTQAPTTACVRKPNSPTGSKNVVITGSNCTTNAGQKVGTQALLREPRGDMRTPRLRCRVNQEFVAPQRLPASYGKNFVSCARGKLVLRTFGANGRVRLTWQSPATETFAKYSKRTTVRLR